MNLYRLISTALPNPDPEAPPGFENIISIVGWIKWGALTACIVGIIISGAMIALASRRESGADHLPKVLWAVLGAAIIAASTWLIEMFVS